MSDDPYRGEQPVTRSVMEQWVSQYANDRLVPRDKQVQVTARTTKWLAAAVLVLSCVVPGLAVGWWTGLSLLQEHLAELRERVENGPATPDERHAVTRQQDEALCERSCMALPIIDGVRGVHSLTATCLWQEHGIRACSCACGMTAEVYGVMDERVGQPTGNFVPNIYRVTESR